jgi:hypothetical protein
MPTPLTPKTLSGKKTLHVKWRDKVWYPRIVFRALDGRVRIEPGVRRHVGSVSFKLTDRNSRFERRLKCGLQTSSEQTSRPLPMARQIVSGFSRGILNLKDGLPRIPTPPYRPRSPFNTPRSDNSL